jgi:hypothetical protein
MISTVSPLIFSPTLYQLESPLNSSSPAGNYNRRCWVLDQYETISWATPDVGMRKAFIPAFFKTEQGIVMSWIASALESGVRAATQVLLELGLVDEAKAVVEKWMARWIDV